MSRGTLDTRPVALNFAYGVITLFDPVFQQCSTIEIDLYAGPQPRSPEGHRFGLHSLSLAATKEIDVSFFSSGYLDVSVHRVPSSQTMDSSVGDGALPPPGFPIRTSMVQSLLAAPHGFSQLATSFFGVWCQGIHPVLLFA